VSGAKADPAYQDRFIQGMTSLVDQVSDGRGSVDDLRRVYDNLPHKDAVQLSRAVSEHLAERAIETGDYRPAIIAEAASPRPWDRDIVDTHWQALAKRIQRDEPDMRGLSADGVVLAKVLHEKIDREAYMLPEDVRDNIKREVTFGVREKEEREGPIDLRPDQRRELTPPDLLQARRERAERAVEEIEAQLLLAKTPKQIGTVLSDKIVVKVRGRLADYPDLAGRLDQKIDETQERVIEAEQTRREAEHELVAAPNRARAR
jgi:hypothetical protein